MKQYKLTKGEEFRLENQLRVYDNMIGEGFTRGRRDQARKEESIMRKFGITMDDLLYNHRIYVTKLMTGELERPEYKDNWGRNPIL